MSEEFVSLLVEKNYLTCLYVWKSAYGVVSGVKLSCAVLNLLEVHWKQTSLSRETKQIFATQPSCEKRVRTSRSFLLYESSLL